MPFSRQAGSDPAADEIVEGHHLGPDETAFDVGVYLARRWLRLRALAERPGAALVLARRQERDQAEQRIGGADHAIEPRLFEAEILEKGLRIFGGELQHLALDRG